MKHARTNHPVSRQSGKQQNPSGRFSLLISFAPLAIIGTLLLAFLFAANQNSAVYALDEGNQIASNGQIGDFVWLDENGNGLQDPGEPGVAGVSVTIFDTEDNNAVETTMTDSNGFYSFTDLEAGEYRVGFTLPTNHSFTAGDADGEGLDGISNSDVVTQTDTIGFTNPFQLGADATNMNVDAGLLPTCYNLRWEDLGYVNGNPAPQTFSDVLGLGLDVTVEVRVVDESFNDLGPYIGGSDSTPPPFPRVENWGVGSPFSVRNIADSEQAGRIVSIITFSDNVTINNITMESIGLWTDPNPDLYKRMGLQAFNGIGGGADAVTPGYYNVQEASSNVTVAVENHPANSKPWLVANVEDAVSLSGVNQIRYGTQPIRQLHWYSWAESSVGGSLSRQIGSTYLYGFSFCQLTPTAVSLIDLQSSNVPALPWVATLVAMVFMTGLLLVVRRREEVNG